MSCSTEMARRSAVMLMAAITSGLSYPTAALAHGTATTGQRVLSTRRVGPRALDLTIDSPALGRTAPARVLLPADFESAPDRTWPVLYLLHGAHDDYTSWTRETGIEAFTAGKNLLTVMPDSGPTGIPTDWWDHDDPEAPDYETFQADEVFEVLQQRYRADGVRVVAGISTGGYGAMAHACRRAGAFRAAASYSGLLDTKLPGIPSFVRSIVARENLPPDSLWGSPKAQADNWRAHNPRHRAASLRGTTLYVSHGSGLLPRTEDPWDAGLLESIMWPTTRSFVGRLETLAIPVTTHLYRGGLHTWSYWWPEFLASWPLLARELGLDSA